jgi:pimeloyl-ACP methyl ester carboxylesterase
MRPEPFRIEIDDARLDELNRRLRATSWAEDFGNADWDYGVERGWLEEMVRYFCFDFDWRAQEAAMNRFEHFRVVIDGVPIHFLHARGRGPDPKPLILTHGWPWTFWDWKDVIPRLADPAAYGGDPRASYDVVVPSLPGFAFSKPLTTTGLDPRTIARLWVRLMRDVLGYARFGAVGGDWGAQITAELGVDHADVLSGIQLTMPVLPGVDGRYLPAEAYAADEQWMVRRRDEALPLIASHIAVHMHDPQTLAYALADSPVGTAAWIWERRRAWSDCEGDVARHFGRDFLCTTASLYWLTNTIGSSLRIYKEAFNPTRPPAPREDLRVKTPVGLAIAPKELAYMPRKMAEARCDLRRWTILPRGGHFAPAEQPEAIANDVRAFFGELETC